MLIRQPKCCNDNFFFLSESFTHFLLILQHTNHLNLEDLLNPEPEKKVIEHATDEDIYNTVVASQLAEENMDLVGGADDKDNDAEILPHPSRKKALAVAATLERYISVLEKPYTRRLEGLLMSFGLQTHFEQTQSMVTTQITDHFYFND